MSRTRGFSLVLHDVQKGNLTKQDVIDHLMLKEPVQAVVAEEPYGHQEGSHIHVFYRLSNPSAFKTHLKHWILWWKAGRVQLDAMLGTIAESCRYLTQEDTRKNKLCDPTPYFFPSRNINVSPEEHAEAWLTSFLQDTWGKNFPLENFISAYSTCPARTRTRLHV